jgi:hypothetical protein
LQQPDNAAAVVVVSGHVGLLVVDFDDTITEKDTIGALMTAAVEANVKVRPLIILLPNPNIPHYSLMMSAPVRVMIAAVVWNSNQRASEHVCSELLQQQV